MSGKREAVGFSKPFVLLIIGVVAGIFLIFIGSNEKTDAKEASSSIESDIELTDKYIRELENRLALILDNMDGISDVSVIITAKECAEIVYAQDSKYSGGSLVEKEYVMADESGMPIKLKIIYPKIKGVAIVCRGGSNPINRESIVDLVTSLLDISSSSVCVVS